MHTHTHAKTIKHLLLCWSEPNVNPRNIHDDKEIFSYFLPLSQWIGFVGNILTRNHRFSHESHGAFRFQFSQQNQSIDCPLFKIKSETYSWYKEIFWLVVWNIWTIFPDVGNVTIPTVTHSYFSEGWRKTTNQIFYDFLPLSPYQPQSWNGRPTNFLRLWNRWIVVTVAWYLCATFTVPVGIGGDRWGMGWLVTGWGQDSYPLVNIQKAMERSTVFNG